MRYIVVSCVNAGQVWTADNLDDEDLLTEAADEDVIVIDTTIGKQLDPESGSWIGLDEYGE